MEVFCFLLQIASDVDDESYFDECDEVTPQEDDIISACPFLSEEDKVFDLIDDLSVRIIDVIRV